MALHETVQQEMMAMAAAFATQGITLQLPPPSNAMLGTRYTNMDRGKTLTAEFTYDPRLTNPLGSIQGGFMCAAFDDVCGPLTYMAAKRPAHTIEMSTSFVRPFTHQSSIVTIRAEVVAQTKSLLILKAEAHSADGKLLATHSQHALISTDQNISRIR